MSGHGEEARRLARETLIEFAQTKAAEARAHQANRVSMAAGWRDGTAADHEEGRKLAEQTSGRSMRKHSAAERERLAAADERIAAAADEEAATFEAIASHLARPLEPPRDDGYQRAIERVDQFRRAMDDGESRASHEAMRAVEDVRNVLLADRTPRATPPGAASAP